MSQVAKNRQSPAAAFEQGRRRVSRTPVASSAACTHATQAPRTVVNHQSKAAQLALKFLQTFYYDVEWVEADSKAYRRCVTGALETVRRTACRASLRSIA